MITKRMPAIFIGHGSPMLALENNAQTQRLHTLGQQILQEHGKPKAILMISAHWYKNRTLVQKTERPKQVFDMYGFPQALYQVKYTPNGCTELSDAVLGIKELGAHVDNTWGIDHGAWTVLVHVFPAADVPVVELSVNGVIGPEQCYEIGRLLAPLRQEGYLVIGSGNIVHNLRMVNWESDQGSMEAEAFNAFICKAVEARDDHQVINYSSNEYADYAAPTSDHFLPLLYILGASEGEKPLVFNNKCTLDSLAMTGFAFGL
ncbi:MAG: 4,5-DOPA dioxygenase extradiol [Prevotella sp.]|nr:4,5-DOPA dioxygenase extradiol [Prevotella sp.]MCH3995741.1 4,5-DOPA dioxygenase extradiol [Prevotella sp.]MCH4100189.1 4,5-DOPA dioxygenase extradiol [Prevotella sp.]